MLVCEYSIFFSIPTIIFIQTNDLSMSAIASVIEFLPRVVCFSLILFVIDKVLISRQIIISDCLRIGALLFSLLFFGSSEYFLFLLGGMGIISMWSVIKFEKIVSQITDEADQKMVISYSQGIDQLSRVLGGGVSILAVRDWNISLSINILFLSMALLFFLRFRALGLEGIQVSHHKTADFFISTQRNIRGKRKKQTSREAKLENFSMKSFFGMFRTLVPLIVIVAALNFIDGAIRTILPSLVVEHIKASPEIAPALIMISYILGTVLSFLFSYLNRFLGERFLCISSIIIMVGGVFIMYYSTIDILFYLGVIFFLGFRVWFNIIARVARNRLVSAEHFGKLLSIYLPIIFLPFVLSGVVIDTLSDRFTSYEILQFIGYFFLVCTILLVLLRKGIFSLLCSPKLSNRTAHPRKE